MIYLDYHATTPVDPRALTAMMPFLTHEFGNPSSTSHPFGQRAAEAVERARAQVAALLGASPDEIVFTAGATEATNLALVGLLAGAPPARRHVVTGATEHKGVLATCRHLEALGCEVTVLAPDATGRIAPEAVEAALTDRTLAVSLMHANNEVGTLHPIAEIGALCRARGIAFHTDAAQSVGKVPVDVQAANVDLLSMSGHKIYAPKGVGALFARREPRRMSLAPVIHGSGHEGGLRSGTLNVPGIVALGEACAIATTELATEAARIGGLRDRLQARLLSAVPGAVVHGHPTERLPGNLSIAFPGTDARSLIAALPEVAVSAGSACNSDVPEPSHVLRALGVRDDLALATLRFGLGRGTTAEETDFAAERTIAAVHQVRAARAGASR